MTEDSVSDTFFIIFCTVCFQRCKLFKLYMAMIYQAKLAIKQSTPFPRVQVETKAIWELMTVAVDSLDVEVKDEEYVE